MDLTAVEQRVLGSLVEKAMTTPDVYPLTTNALVAACNQASNRDPVTSYTEDEVLAAVGSLRELGLVRSVKRAGDRVMKHRHDVEGELRLAPEAVAVLAVLLLRGAQTPGELRGRTDRYADLGDTEAVEAVLGELAAGDPPLAARLERRPGQKEARWVHRLGPVAEPRHDPDGEPGPSRRDRLAELEAEVERLRAEVGVLADGLDAIRRDLGA
jgi:uncharacterized protein YceH (UPF0502 family)